MSGGLWSGRLLRIACGLELEQGFEGLIEGAAVAGFVAVKEFEGAAGVSEGAEGMGGAVGGSEVFVVVVEVLVLVDHHQFGDGGFAGVAAVEPPGSDGEAVDEFVLGGGEGLVLVDEFLPVPVEFVFGFAVENDELGVESVSAGILRRRALAFRSYGAMRFCAVGAGVEDFLFSGHDRVPGGTVARGAGGWEDGDRYVAGGVEEPGCGVM